MALKFYREVAVIGKKMPKKEKKNLQEVIVKKKG